MSDDVERRIEEERREGEGWLAEWLLLRPNRFSAERAGNDVLALGLLTLLCMLPAGPLALIRWVRCADQRRAAGAPPSVAARIGGIAAIAGTVIQVTVLVHLLGD